MIECKKTEALLWTYHNLSGAEKLSVDLHLKECAPCRQAMETISLLQSSSAANDRTISAIDATAFDNAVMAKIRNTQKTATLESEISRQYIVRTAFSFALAAGIVLFVVRSISDLSVPLPQYRGSRSPADTMSERFSILNLRLSQQEQSSQPREKLEQKSTETRVALTPPPLAVKKPATESEALSDELVKEEPKDNAILSAPVTAPSPDSVNIEAVYLANTTPMTTLQQQSRAALHSDVYVDTGAFQSVVPPSSVLVTIDKMPQSIQMVVPEYPVWARKRGLSATVWVKARIDETGNVSESQIISCTAPGEGFEDAALSAAKKSKFQPGVANGVNIPVWVAYPVKFIFQENH